MRILRNSGIILLISILFWCCGTNDQPDRITRKVKIETVKATDTFELREFAGRVRENAELNLSFRVAGPVTEIKVREGDFVQAGQLLAQMDRRDYLIQLNAAEAQYEQVKSEAERVIELYKRSSVPVNEYDKAVSGLKMVESKLEHARQQLNDTRLVAPVSGYIQRINFSQNELVDAGIPVLSLLDVSRYQVEVDVPASVYTRRDDILSFSGAVRTMPDVAFDLRLLGIKRKANQNQLYRMNLGFSSGSNPDLASGMDVMVNILFRDDAGPVVCVPVTALFSEDGQTFVWVYDSATQKVARREVTTGKLAGEGRINIVSGLQPGEHVVVAGVTLIGDNERVEPLEPVSETNVGGLL